MRTAIAAILAALALAAPAEALDDDWRATAGIAKAKAAGVQIDPAVEEAMARAPVGSCPNDPTQPNCPHATRVLESPTVELADGALAFAPGPAATATTARDAAQWPWQCQLRLSDASPYKAAGLRADERLGDLL
jgi:hypothetical protein